MKQIVVELEYDSQRLPLGKITAEQIRAGYEALNTIADLVNSIPAAADDQVSDASSILHASNVFYTMIPHSFGFKAPPAIDTAEQIAAKMVMLETLSNIRVAMRVISTRNGVGPTMNHVDRMYKNIGCSIDHLSDASPERQMLENYIMSTQGNRSMNVLEIYKCSRQAEFRDMGNRTLLFHGSRLSNWAGILRQGLRVAPVDVPTSGSMFGNGVYFADMSDTAAGYCRPNKSSGNVLIMALCEVSLGRVHVVKNADYKACGARPGDTDSTMGLGRVGPRHGNQRKMSDGTVVPLGPPRLNSEMANHKSGFLLDSNEYIVYDEAQIRMRYLAKIKVV